MNLEPLVCSGCGAALPLADAERLDCPYCHAETRVPKRHRKLWAEHAVEASTRRDAERRFRALAKPPSAAVDVLAVALVLALPALVAAAAVTVSRYPPPTVTVFAAFIVPALLPGTGLWLWSASVHATVVRFQLALSGEPPERAGGPPRCRACGAPLAVEPDAISAHCPYCGTDSLVTDVAAAARRIQSALRQELRTLAQAVEVIRLRRRLVAGGAVAATALLGVLALVTLVAYAAMW